MKKTKKKAKTMKLYAKKKVSTFVEALPYLRKFHGRTILIKLGGSVLIDNKLKNSMLKDIALLNFIGLNPVIVHGGGPDISKEMEKRA